MSSKNMKRAIFFVDGFNLYHSINDDEELHPYKWLNLKSLSNHFINKNIEINKILFFTSMVKGNPIKYNRQECYHKALRFLDIKIILGKRKEAEIKCRLCNGTFNIFEEKKTDVNIAVKLIEYAFDDLYDVAYIISGDSDLVPAIEYVQDKLNKDIWCLFPIGRHAMDMKSSASGYTQMTSTHYKAHRLPDSFIDKKGRTIKSPTEWELPK